MNDTNEEELLLGLYESILAGRRFQNDDGTVLYEFAGGGLVYVTDAIGEAARTAKYELLKDGNCFYFILDTEIYKLRGMVHPEESTHCNILITVTKDGEDIRDTQLEEVRI